jgi:3-hydroxyisobutyrate dehydrogenase
MTARIALIGTGGMGQGMARCLLRTGHDLTVCNRSPHKAQPLIEVGATLAATPAQAATAADVIISMVGDDDDSQQVWLGPEGVLAGRPRPGTLAIESTTLSLGWVQHLGRLLPAAGLRFIDSPVTGGRQAAEEGTLTLLVGAHEADLAAARPVLETYSHQILHFGPPGSGTAYKLVVNLMAGVQTVALAEGLLLAERCGLDLPQVIEALTMGAVSSPIVQAYAQKMVSAQHLPATNFRARWMLKDMRYALALAVDKGQPMPASAAAAQAFARVEARGLLDHNITAVIEALK